MDSDTLVLIWVVLCGIALCNFISGCCAALFHIWSGTSTPGVRILSAAAMGGFVPAIAVGGLVMLSAGTGLVMDAWVVMSAAFLAGLIAGLPLAFLVTGKLPQSPALGAYFE